MPYYTQASPNYSVYAPRVGGRDWMKEVDLASQSALGANVARYGDIFKGYAERYNQGMGYLNDLGRTQRADINQRYQADWSRAQQDLASRGLLGSTISPTLQLGYAKARDQAILGLNESLAQQRLGTHAQLSGDVLRFAEARTDEYPDYAQMLNLAQVQGRYGMGMRGPWS